MYLRCFKDDTLKRTVTPCFVPGVYSLNLCIPYVFVYVGVTQGEVVLVNDSQKHLLRRQKNIF